MGGDKDKDKDKDGEEGHGENTNTRLLSQEQELKRTRNKAKVEVSSAKKYSLVATILVLLILLLTSNMRDWQYFKQGVSEEEKYVGQVAKDDMIIKEVHPHNNKGSHRIAVDDLKDKSDQAKTKVEIDRLKRELEDLRKKKKKPAAAPSPSGKANKAKAKTPKKKPKKSTKTKVKGDKSKSKVSIKISDQEKKDLRAKKVKPNSVHALGKEGYEKYLLQDHAKKMDNHQKKMVARKFELPEDVQAIVDGYQGSLAPPEYCYKTPTGEPAYPREPDEEDAKYAGLPLDVAKKILRLASAHYPCLIASQECMDPDKYQYADKYYQVMDKLNFRTKAGVNSTLTKEEKIARLPAFESLKLGTCAMVGNADNLLERNYGKEIEDHDFIVRFNVITEPYKDHVGHRADGMLIKTNYKNTENHRDVVPTMYNLFPKYTPFELNPENLPGGKMPWVYNTHDYSDWRRDEEQMFWAYIEEKNLTTSAGFYGDTGVPKLPHPTGGITRVRSLITLLRSGVCDRLDLYGFSIGGGKYFKPEAKVSTAHPIQSENYFYRLWMATGVQGKFCVYGK
ncbi:sialyltransferase [Chloropicon primus]|uniref:Uncharacterized protein n=1 Tax=Chloropicon primus TaxID=1764295 RepID=A0A5B8MNE3_9CHLO|nr:hypothetical protein A3770_07p46140 [Chloropicon primus]UPR01314.1 sialyltransferase [Chloropicon primus]|eukprot:QDZ22096.1 hypothetical protein A3770_07p46140 [Chloropicon primus]